MLTTLRDTLATMWTLSFYCTLSILLLGYVLAAYRTNATFGMLAWLTACIVSLFGPVLLQRKQRAESNARTATAALLITTIGMFTAYQLTSGVFQNAIVRNEIAVWLLAGVAFTVLISLRGNGITLRMFRTYVFPLILAGFLFVSVKTIRDNPKPFIDVYSLQQAGVNAIGHLQNPYTATIPDIYGASSPFYVDFVENGRTVYGFSYMPVILFMELPSYLLTGDIRYTHVFALLLTSILIAAMRTSWFSAAAAVLMLVNPMSLALVQFAWVEPLTLLLFAALLFSVLRFPKAVPWLLGLFFASKQTNLAILPLVPLLFTGAWEFKPVAQLAASALAIVAVVCLPFYLWNPHAFVLSLITVQVSVPLRLDLISYPAYMVKKGWPKPPIWLPFLYLPFASILCWLRAPRTPAAFAWATALFFVPFFALSKQGSPNYYFFALGALCCAVALSPAEE